MKITLDYIPDDCIEEVAQIESMSITYSQPADTNSKSDEWQFLTISTAQGGCSEDDIYYNISIKDCEHWSVSSPDDFVFLINDFINRLKINTIKEKDIKRCGSEK